MKKSIKMAILAVVAVLGAGLFAVPVLAQDCDPTAGLVNGVKCAQTDEQPEEIFGKDGLFNKIVNILLFLIGAISVVMIVFAGFQYATSGGDAGKVTTAKNTILYAVIGIVVALLAYAIIGFVTDQLV